MPMLSLSTIITGYLEIWDEFTLVCVFHFHSLFSWCFTGKFKKAALSTVSQDTSGAECQAVLWNHCALHLKVSGAGTGQGHPPFLPTHTAYHLPAEGDRGLAGCVCIVGRDSQETEGLSKRILPSPQYTTAKCDLSGVIPFSAPSSTRLLDPLSLCA